MSAKLESLITTICFSLLNALFLMQHFTVLGAVSLALVVLYYFFRIDFAATKRAITAGTRIGAYVGAFAANCFLTLAFEDKVFETPPQVNTFWFWPTCLLVVAILFFYNFDKNPKAFGSFGFYLKYGVLFLSTTLLGHIFIKWNQGSVYFLTLLVTVVAMIIDCLDKSESIYAGKVGFRWACAILAAFNIMTCLYNSFAIKMVDLIFNFRSSVHTEWYIYLLACALFAVCIIVSHWTFEEYGQSPFVALSYIVMLGWTAMLWILTTCSTPYDVIFVILMLLVTLLFLLIDHKNKTLNIFGIEMHVQSLSLPVAMLLIILLQVSLFYGWFYQCICLSVTVIGSYLFYIIADKKKKSVAPHNTFLFWEFILIMATAFAVIVAATRNNYVGNFVVIAVVFAIVTAANAFINHDNKRLPQNSTVLRAVMVGCAVLMLVLGNQPAIRANISVDNKISDSQNVSAKAVGETGKIRIEIKAKDFENSEFFYYWSDKKEKIAKLKVKEGVPTEIKFRNACLNIVCRDENGTVTTYNRWFYNPAAVKKTAVGAPGVIFLDMETDISSSIAEEE